MTIRIRRILGTLAILLLAGLAATENRTRWTTVRG